MRVFALSAVHALFCCVVCTNELPHMQQNSFIPPHKHPKALFFCVSFLFSSLASPQQPHLPFHPGQAGQVGGGESASLGLRGNPRPQQVPPFPGNPHRQLGPRGLLDVAKVPRVSLKRASSESKS